MTKKELIGAVAVKAEVTVKEADKIVNTALDVIQKELVGGGTVDIQGFGKFSVSCTGERTGRNPQTGEPMQISASKNVKFKAGKSLKDAVK